MTTEKQKIFFSYSRADGSAFALRLAQDLKQKGFDVWIDQEDIKAGAEWDREIAKALEACNCVLFLETEKSVASNHVLDEVYYALEQKKKVIPLIYVDAKTPFRLNRLQHIDFTRDYNTGLGLLMKELESAEQALAYATENETLQTTAKKPVRARGPLTVGLIVGIAVLMIAVFFVFTKETSAPVEIVSAAAPADTLTATQHQRTPGAATNTAEEVEENPATESGSTIVPKKVDRTKKGVVVLENVKTVPAVSTLSGEDNSRNLNSLVAGNWRLTGVEPAAESQRGYLKIEAADGNKATIKTYVQFYYPEKEASSYLTVFNAFAGCVSCEVSREMKLTTEDVAIASRTIKKLAEDGPDGRKAGEVILDASANKSVGGTVSLQFVDNNTAVIRIKQSRTITLANELVLEPFEYTFRFKKSD
jgi:hypothetical protein